MRYPKENGWFVSFLYGLTLQLIEINQGNYFNAKRHVKAPELASILSPKNSTTKMADLNPNLKLVSKQK